MSKKIMKCVSEPSGNQYFDHPYLIGEKVIYVGEVEPKPDSKNSAQFHKQFIRIKRLKPLEDRVESRKNFEFV
jgi:hypothetical protein